MTIDLTRRRRKVRGSGGGPTFASRTPMRIGMVTLRVRNLDLVADYCRDAIGLTVMAPTTKETLLGSSINPAQQTLRWTENEVRPLKGYRTLFLLAGTQGRLPACTLLAWRRGDHLDLLLLGFLGFPIASLLAFGHVNLPGLMVTRNLILADIVD